jgi:glycosidase
VKTDYHGYWVTNYDRVNAHFGDWNLVHQLSKALHQHGMRYIQDITLNDSNPNDVHVFGRLYHGVETEKVLVDSYADDFDFLTGMRFYKHFDSDPRCVQDRVTPDGQQTYWQLHHCSLGDLSGYNQHDPTIANYLIGAGGLWLANGVDDFRLDAVKYPFPDFIASFTHAMIEKSRLLGRGTPYIVGEWSTGGAGVTRNLSFSQIILRYFTPTFSTSNSHFILTSMSAARRRILPSNSVGRTWPRT